IVNLVRNDVKEIRAVSDIVGSPTFAADFAANLLPVIRSAPFGLYHMSNKGGCSRFELASKIVEFMGKARKIPVYPVPASEFPTAAPRPKSELLRNRNLELLGLDNMPTWEESLQRYVRAL
ncbi:MAG: sugar nucleotide-binding protein, partial [Planctomycetota bacterium]|nr:sugar nucleotide-binding protein [Planctomycetota bacterium]